MVMPRGPSYWSLHPLNTHLPCFTLRLIPPYPHTITTNPITQQPYERPNFPSIISHPPDIGLYFIRTNPRRRQAAECYEEAVRLGHATAGYNLALLAAAGHPVTSRHDVTGLLERAAAAGSRQAAQFLPAWTAWRQEQESAEQESQGKGGQGKGFRDV